MAHLRPRRHCCTNRGMTLLFGLSFVALALGSAGAALARTSSGAISSETTAPPPEIVVTRDAGGGLPGGCSPQRVATFVNRFFDDFNHGRSRLLGWRLAPPATTRDVGVDARDGRLGFRGYSVTTVPGKHFAAGDRATALKYFKRRHLKNEQLRLVMIDVAPGGTATYTVDMTLVFLREANDLPVSADAYGYGAATLNCAPTSISVWKVSGPLQSGVSWPCPQPSDWAPGTSAIACTRG